MVMTNRKFERLFGGPPRRPESPLTQREMDIAASIQAVAEEAMLRATRHVHQQTGLKNLALDFGMTDIKSTRAGEHQTGYHTHQHRPAAIHGLNITFPLTNTTPKFSCGGRLIGRSDKRAQFAIRLTRGKGIAVHSTTCPNVVGMLGSDRLTEVKWTEGPSEDESYTVRLSIAAEDRQGILAHLAQPQRGRVGEEQ
jgi:hypothetical protein